MGASVVIAVNLQHDVFGKGSVLTDHLIGLEDDVEPAAAINDPKGGGALRLLHRQFFGQRGDAPGISTVMMEAFNITQDRIARSRLAGDPPDFTIAPRLSNFSSFDFHRADELIALGVSATERALEDIRETVAAVA